ncbi:hypothetical protein [Pseudomonas aeruginosa]|uniref:hypothetical protein n=1 Tax=Pseudomonas aeruginosa TaxID=287 RepID=UPI0012FE5279|nr:hypothetical protein [Pseudomonas aeruginosa]
MSFIGDLAFEDQRALEDEALANPAVNDTSPDFWDGSLDSIGTGFIRGAFEAASSVEAGFNNLWISGLDAAASAFLPEPRGGGTPSVTDAETMLRDEQAKANAEYITNLRPDPETTGMAAQVTGELAAVIPRTIAGFAAGGQLEEQLPQALRLDMQALLRLKRRELTLRRLELKVLSTLPHMGLVH